MNHLPLPRLTEADPIAAGEGSLDPLGLYAVADALGVRLVPGVRERQHHPRFLTAMAVSRAVCDGLEDDVAKDGVSQPWQVFEWHVVEGLVRTVRDKKAIAGLPGQDKVGRAINDGVPLSARRYLVTPTVFGFHGVYRRLARDLEIETDAAIGETGFELLKLWSEEQDLPGFIGSAGGKGADWRRTLRDAVQDGLAQGAVARKSGWAGWGFFGEHLAHRVPGERERRFIREALLGREGELRGEVLRFLVSREGRRAWEESDHGERAFHEALATRAGGELAVLLKAILAYEGFARLLQDAFDASISLMATEKGAGRIYPKDCANLKLVKKAAAKVPSKYTDLIDRLTPFGQSIRFQEHFRDLGEPLPPEDWVTRLLEHHRRVQASKPPNGKAPWFDRFDDGGCIVRAAYAERPSPADSDKYVHGYRTTPLWSFANDLGML